MVSMTTSETTAALPPLVRHWALSIPAGGSSLIHRCVATRLEAALKADDFLRLLRCHALSDRPRTVKGCQLVIS